MPVDFFISPCNQLNAICQQQSNYCYKTTTEDQFGISDGNANNRLPAKCVKKGELSDFDIFNETNKQITYKAIDYCLPIYRTGHYDLNNNLRIAATFSSDSTPDARNHLIKRCEGFLLFDNNILFFEIKTGETGRWLADAREKFEETILSFREHNPDLHINFLPPIISNKTYIKKYGYKIHQNVNMQKQILMDKVGLSFTLTDRVNI